MLGVSKHSGPMVNDQRVAWPKRVESCGGVARNEWKKNYGAACLEFVLLKAVGVWFVPVATGHSRAEQCVAADRREDAPPAERKRWASESHTHDPWT